MAEKPLWRQNKYIRDNAYKEEHYSRIVMDIPKERKARLQEAAKQHGLSLTAFILECVKQVAGI